MSELVRPISALTLKRRTDDEVFARALRGDDLAFSEVYHRYYTRIYGFCLSRTASPEIAHDAAQETFTRFLSADADAISSPVPWLYSVARHVCIDVARRQHRTTTVDDIAATVDRAGNTCEEAAEQEALRRDDAASVFLALRRMRPRYRNALVLREIHHQSMDSIADTLKVRESTAYTVLSRARDAFGKAYAQVLELPAPCRLAVEQLYRRSGTGLSAAESTALEQHLSDCPRCQRERDRAADVDRMPALLPLLALRARSGVLGNAARMLGDTAPALESAARIGPAFASPLARVASVATVSLTLAVGGGVAASNVARMRHEAAPGQPVATRQIARAATSAGSCDASMSPLPCEGQALLTRERLRRGDSLEPVATRSRTRTAAGAGDGDATPQQSGAGPQAGAGGGTSAKAGGTASGSGSGTGGAGTDAPKAPTTTAGGGPSSGSGTGLQPGPGPVGPSGSPVAAPQGGVSPGPGRQEAPQGD